MNNEKVSKILKKYNIYENRSVQEMLELLDVKCDSLLERYNRTKNEDIQEEINEIQEVIEYIGKNEAQMSTLLTLMEEETAVNHQTDNKEAIERLRESSGQASGAAGQASNNTQQSSAQQGGAATMQNLTQGSFWFSSNTGNQTVNNLFVQAEDCLKYGEWEKAEHVFDSILAAESKNPGIFMGKLLAQYKLVKPGELANKTEYPLETDINLRKAHDFGNPQQAKYIEDLLIEYKKIKIYKEAVVLSAKNTGTDLRKAAVLFDQIADYRDAKMQAELCRNNADKIDNDAREAQRQQSKKELLKSKLEQFSNIEPGDGIYDLRRLEDLHSEITEIMKEIPETTSKLSEDVLWDMDRKLRDAREYSGFMKKKKFRVNSFVAWILLVLSVLLGINWNYNLPMVSFLPTSVFDDTIAISAYPGSTYVAFGKYVDTCLKITNSNVEKVYMPLTESFTSVVVSETDATSLEIPSTSSVTIENAMNVKEVLLPEAAQNVLISGVSKLEKLAIPDAVSEFTLKESKNKEFTLEYSGHSNGELLLENCTNLKKLVLPEGFSTLTITGCESLEDIVIPNGITTLNITGCESLEDVVIPKGVSILTITQCGKLNNITLSESVSEVVIEDCDSLVTLDTFEKGVDVLTLQGCDGLTEIDIPKNVNTVKLYECNELTAFKTPDTLKRLAVNDCERIITLDLPENVEYVSVNGANLEHVKINGEINHISGYSYSYVTENGNTMTCVTEALVIDSVATFTQEGSGSRRELKISGAVKDLCISDSIAPQMKGDFGEIDIKDPVGRLTLSGHRNLGLSFPDEIDELIVNDCTFSIFNEVMNVIDREDVDVRYYERDGKIIIDKREKVNE